VLGGVTVPPRAARWAFGRGRADPRCLGGGVGALALGDLGRLFPDTDPRYAGVSSLLLLQAVMDLIATKGAHLVNVDCHRDLPGPTSGPVVEECRSASR